MNNSYFDENDLNNRLVNLFRDCPYEGHRKDCTFHEMREMKINEKMDFLKKMNDSEKIIKWRKHLECLMNSLPDEKAILFMIPSDCDYV